MKINFKNIINHLDTHSINVVSQLEEDFEFSGINSIIDANKNELTFFSNKNYESYLTKTKAKACLIKKEFTNILPQNCFPIIVDDPYQTFAIVSQLFNNENKYNKKIKPKDVYISSSSKISDDVLINNFSSIMHNVEINSGVIIGSNVSIGPNVHIGKNTMINDNVSLSNCIIENDCVIKSGARIGETGFGFDPKSKKEILHRGNVIIKSNSYIGSNTTIDRAVFKSTYIGEYSHIDNLVQIAHNVIIEKHAIIAAQVGIAGSTVIGNNVKIGGQAGVSGHLKIGNNVTIAAKSGVTKNILDNQTVAGFPAKDIKVWKKEVIKISRNL